MPTISPNRTASSRSASFLLSTCSSFNKSALATISDACAANTVSTRIVASWNRSTIESLPT